MMRIQAVKELSGGGSRLRPAECLLGFCLAECEHNHSSSSACMLQATSDLFIPRSEAFYLSATKRFEGEGRLVHPLHTWEVANSRRSPCPQHCLLCLCRNTARTTRQKIQMSRAIGGDFRHPHTTRCLRGASSNLLMEQLS